MLLGALLLGCSGAEDGGTTAHDATSAIDAAKARDGGSGCATDPECTGGWDPEAPACGPIQRCIGGRCALPPASTGATAVETGRLVFETAAGEVAFQVEVQDTPFERRRGMMCRRALRSDWGMLFLQPETEVQRFWMRHTLIPLDMVFLDEGWTVVGVAADAVPETLTPRFVDAPSRYVLELNAGTAARAGVLAGAHARFYAPAEAR